MKAALNSFVNTFLSRPASGIPKGAQWAVFFDDLQQNILPSITNAYVGEPGQKWRTEEAAKVITTDLYQTNDGCLFCQAISLPGEGSTPVAEGLKTNGYIRTYVGAGRNDFPVLRMSFLETNISFADTFLRGWALATSKFGMIARSGNKNYRTNMTCYKFSVGPKGSYVSSRLRFEGICCVGIGDEEFNYDHVTSSMKRDAQFVYNSYSIDAMDGMDPSILQNMPAG